MPARQKGKVLSRTLRDALTSRSPSQPQCRHRQTLSFSERGLSRKPPHLRETRDTLCGGAFNSQLPALSALQASMSMKVPHCRTSIDRFRPRLREPPSDARFLVLMSSAKHRLPVFSRLAASSCRCPCSRCARRQLSRDSAANFPRLETEPRTALETRFCNAFLLDLSTTRLAT